MVKKHVTHLGTAHGELASGVVGVVLFGSELDGDVRMVTVSLPSRHIVWPVLKATLSCISMNIHFVP